MPYSSNVELPKGVKTALSEFPHAMDIWRNAFNSAFQQYKTDEAAARVAWAAVGTKYEKQGDKWVAKHVQSGTGHEGQPDIHTGTGKQSGSGHESQSQAGSTSSAGRTDTTSDKPSLEAGSADSDTGMSPKEGKGSGSNQSGTGHEGQSDDGKNRKPKPTDTTGPGKEITTHAKSEDDATASGENVNGERKDKNKPKGEKSEPSFEEIREIEEARLAAQDSSEDDDEDDAEQAESPEEESKEGAEEETREDREKEAGQQPARARQRPTIQNTSGTLSGDGFAERSSVGKTSTEEANRRDDKNAERGAGKKQKPVPGQSTDFDAVREREELLLAESRTSGKLPDGGRGVEDVDQGERRRVRGQKRDTPNIDARVPTVSSMDSRGDYQSADANSALVEEDITDPEYGGVQQDTPAGTHPARRRAPLPGEAGLGDNYPGEPVAGGYTYSVDPKKFAAMRTGSIRGVELFMPGKWNGDDYTDQDILEIVKNASSVGFSPPLKIGHSETQQWLQEDGHPAAGYIQNIRVDHGKLVGDFVDVPKGIVDLIRVGSFDRISPELYINYAKNGQNFGKVLKAVALLGSDIPAIPDLRSLRSYFGDEEKDTKILDIQKFAYQAADVDFLEPDLEAFVSMFAGLVDKPWDGSKSRFTPEQLERSVPRAVATWARKRAKDGQVAKEDLKLPYKEPSGEINLHGVRAALESIGGAHGNKPDLPPEVLSAAQAELHGVLSRTKQHILQWNGLITQASEISKHSQEEGEEMSETVVKDMNEKLARQDAEIRGLKRRNYMQECKSFIDGIERDGKLPPALEPIVLKMFETLHDHQVVVKFGDNEVTPIGLFKQLLTQLPQVVDFGDRSVITGSENKGGSRGTASVSRELDTAVRKYRAEHPKVSYEDAFNFVLESNDDLRMRYIQS